MKFLNLATLIAAELISRRRNQVYKRLFDVALAAGAVAGAIFLGLAGIGAVLVGFFYLIREATSLPSAFFATGLLALLVSIVLGLVGHRIFRELP